MLSCVQMHARACVQVHVRKRRHVGLNAVMRDDDALITSFNDRAGVCACDCECVLMRVRVCAIMHVAITPRVYVLTTYIRNQSIHESTT